jgi:ABC-type enterochelin transport system permease subunit
MQDHKQHRDKIKIIIQLDIVSIFIGSQQTQHVELYNDDLDHDRQLTRSKHEAHGRDDNHLATAMDP